MLGIDHYGDKLCALRNELSPKLSEGVDVRGEAVVGIHFLQDRGTGKRPGLGCFVFSE